MNINHLLSILIVVFLSSTACSADNALTSTENTQDVQLAQSDPVTPNGQSHGKFSISDKFRPTLLEKGFSIEAPEEIEPSKLIDNMRQLKIFFDENTLDFFTYTSLSKYHISNSTNRSIVSLYSFHFKSKEAATSWFNVFDKTKLKGQIKITFSRPKKMLGLVGSNVIFVEGYMISDFEPLKFIVSNIDGIESILDPKYTRPR